MRGWGWLLIFGLVSGDGTVIPAFEEEFVYEAQGKRDPFSPPVSSTKSSGEVAGKLTELKNLEVQGIFWDEKNPMAMIGDEILTLGSPFRGAKVVEIHPHAVIFEVQGEKISILVKEEEVSPSVNIKSKKEGKKKEKEKGGVSK